MAVNKNFTNDNGKYLVDKIKELIADKSYSKEEIDEKQSNGFEIIEKVGSLPEKGNTKRLYLLKNTETVRTYSKAVGTYVAETDYFYDVNGNAEVNTDGFQVGVTDVSEYYTEPYTEDAKSTYSINYWNSDKGEYSSFGDDGGTYYSGDGITVDTLNHIINFDYTVLSEAQTVSNATVDTIFGDNSDSTVLDNLTNAIDSFQEQINSKQATLTPGPGIKILNNEITTTLDTDVVVFVDALPDANNAENKLYVNTTDNHQYAVVNQQWNDMGEISFSPENFYTKSETYSKTEVNADFQKKSDSTLNTTNKTVVGAINELHNRPTVYQGTSTPSSSLGKDGDYYIMYVS